VKRKGRGEEMPLKDQAWYEAEYNPRLSVSDAAEYGPKWTEWGEATRQRLNYQSNLTYGDHPREITDVFTVKNAKAAVIFIHGGYWRGFSKDVFSWVAEALNNRGITVAVINYPLCPEVTIADIVLSCRKAIAALWHQTLTDDGKKNLIVAGHSAGGYLTAAMFTADWTGFNMPATPFKVGVPISGVFDVRPLIQTTINEQACLTEESAYALNLLTQQPLVKAPLFPIYGALESSEFRRQSEEIARLWPIAEPAFDFTDRNHFNVVEGMKEPGSPIFEALLRLAMQA